MPSRPEVFLRSVNLGLDLSAPSRFSHFRPTPKSAQVIRAVIEGIPSPATIVVAAYGSGKSLAAGFACLALNRDEGPGPLLAGVLSRLGEFAPELADGVCRTRGLAIALEGAQGDLGDALISAASSSLGSGLVRPGRSGIAVVLDAIAAAAKAKGLDRMAIVWDEFGRHLETLASEGRSHELSQLQQAAEWAARQERPSATLTLLMHQGFFHYSGGLSQAARSAWRKVEGRFGAVRFVDDSREMHRLIASVVEGMRTAVPPLSPEDFRMAAERVLGAGMFPTFAGETEKLAETLRAAWPLDPAALHVLPGLAARVAQHERSVFAFVGSADLSGRVTLKDVYDHFSPSMEADVGIGGSHRRWLETESALSKAEGPDECLAVAAAALLGLGASGQRLKVSRETLLAAVEPWGDLGYAADAVDALLAKNLLLHRRRTDDVSVWHGTDLDLRGRLEDERSRLEADFDLVPFLASRRPAPSVRSVRHNLERWIRRSWSGAYVAASDLCAGGAEHPLLNVGPGEDGRLLYVIAAGANDAQAALEAIPKLLPEDGAVVACVCEEPLPLAELALEVACLARLARDEVLLGSDPLAETEIAHMADAAMEALDRSLERAVTPGKGRQSWFARGRLLEVHDAASLAEELSVIADDRFPKTPEIRNELVVRRSLSRPMVNARKRLLLSILERDGEPHLGCEFMGGTPDVAMYRTVLHRTGLYRQEGDGKWEWAAPWQVRDSGLREVWGAVEVFFKAAGRKPMAAFVDRLLLPPYGVRAGLLPILVAAGMRAFGRAVAVRRDGKWVPDILASEIEEMCSRPEVFEIEVFDLDAGLGDYLRGISEEFGTSAPEEADLLRHAQDALDAWKAQLPENALKSRYSDQTVRSFTQALAYGEDPVDVLLYRLPRVAGSDSPGPETLEAVRKCRKVLESVVEGFQAEAVRAIRETLVVSKADEGDALSRARAWASCFSGGTAVRNGVDAAAKAVLSRAAAATDGRYTEVSFARALSMLLIGLDFDRWTDRTPAEFARRLKAAAGQVEEAALAVRVPDASVRPVLEGRVGDLLAKLVRIAGRGAAAELLDKIAREEVADGDS
ncbi:MAG: hypothetical protein FD119_100 [Stygiobacter sp.]|nr:MAG: hypothetical protein FD119_100 [Stygiobacter sp.]